jgi:hypothetical protein
MVYSPLRFRSDQLVDFHLFSLLRVSKWFAMIYTNMLSAAATPKTISKSEVVRMCRSGTPCPNAPGVVAASTFDWSTLKASDYG